MEHLCDGWVLPVEVEEVNLSCFSGNEEYTFLLFSEMGGGNTLLEV